MNWNEAEGKWDQIKGTVMEKWGKLTDNDLTVMKGKREKLLGKLQELYGYSIERAEREIKEFEASCKSKNECCDKNDKNSCV